MHFLDFCRPRPRLRLASALLWLLAIAGTAQAQSVVAPKILIRPPLSPALAALSITGTLVLTSCYNRGAGSLAGALTVAALPVASGGSVKTAAAVYDPEAGRWTYRITNIAAGKYVVRPSMAAGACPDGGVWRPPTQTVDLLAGSRTVHFVFYGRSGLGAGDSPRSVITRIFLDFHGCRATIDQALIRAVDSSGRNPTVIFRGGENSYLYGHAHVLVLDGLPKGVWEFYPEIVSGSCAEIGGEWRAGESDDPGVAEFSFYATGYVPP